MDNAFPPTPRKPFREPGTDTDPTPCHPVAVSLADTVSEMLSKVTSALAAVAGPTRTQRAATVGFVAVATLDTLYTPDVVTGSWWLILLLVWLMPWPKGSPRSPSALMARGIRYIRFLLIVAVLSWLYVRTDGAIRGILDYWLPFENLPVGLKVLSFPLQDVFVAALTGMLIGVPIFRAFNEKAVAVAAIVTVPWLLTHRLWWFLHGPNWSEQLRIIMSYLFEGVIAVLVFLEICDLLVRRQSSAARISGANRPSLSSIGVARPVRLAFTLGLFLLTLLGFIWYVVAPGPRGTVGMVLHIAAPLLAIAVTTAGVAFFRVFREYSRTVGRALEWPLSVFLLVPVWFWALLHAAPLAAAIFASSLQSRLQQPWAITCDTSNSAVLVQGEFHVGLTHQFRSTLDACPHASSVVLSSGGGLGYEGHAMGLLIKERHLATRVVDYCASACAYAFAGGDPRILQDGAALGFHAGRHSSGFFNLLAHSTDITELPLAQGIDATFLERVAAVPHEEMWYPTNEELLAAGYVTEVPRSTPLNDDSGE